jgi:lipopolysaccharide transport system ATP-binding protein
MTTNAQTDGADGLAIRMDRVSKVYKLYASRQEQVLDSMGLTRLLPGRRKPKFGEFRALHDVSFTVRRGERIGVIGRNGAGKTTMLRLITQNFAPTTGEVEVHGSVQALMQLGLGFHPEFTGHENIVASLNYNGLIGAEFEAALKDVIDFVELGDFLHQPVKSYSMGMQARLQFAAATAIRPDILIVDEVLGAGDAYFAAKSAHRMKKLALSGCTLLLVSHATAEIMRFCERVIWMHRGSVLMDGPALDVVRIYEAHIEELNFRMRKQTEALLRAVDAPAAVSEAVPALTTMADTAAETIVAEVGGAEAATPPASAPAPVLGDAPVEDTEFEEGAPTEPWRRGLFGALLHGDDADHDEEIVRWPGERGLKVRRMRLLDGAGMPVDRAVSGEPLVIEVTVMAEEDGDFEFRISLLFMSLEGVGVTRNFSPYYDVSLQAGESATVSLRLPEVLLTGGEFVFSCALFKHYDMVDSSTAVRYDLLSRSFRLRVEGKLSYDPGLFHQPGSWSENARVGRARSS